MEGCLMLCGHVDGLASSGVPGALQPWILVTHLPLDLVSIMIGCTTPFTILCVRMQTASVESLMWSLGMPPFRNSSEGFGPGT